MMKLLSPENWTDYELIDCGGFEKLERFGQYITIRPEPQAVWNKILSEKDWNNKAHVRFESQSSSSGTWKKLREMPDQWMMRYHIGSASGSKPAGKQAFLTFRLGLTAFKHVGVFPEQSVHWDYIHESVLKLKAPQPKVLNLFAYTGGASLAAKMAGADVVHLDSIRQVITWARENMDRSGLKDIRWLVEDAMKFVRREVKRGNKYQGIILDPPAYGHGPDGENWKLEDNIQEMVSAVFEMLDPARHFLVMNTYSLGFSSLILDNLLRQNSMADSGLETGELFLKSTSGLSLPLGVFGRFRKTGA